MIHFKFDQLWSISVVLYIICSITFCAGPYVPINSLSLYIFLGMSFVNVFLVRKKISWNGYLVSLVIYGILLGISILYTPASAEQRSDTYYDYVTMTIIVTFLMAYIDSYKKINMILSAVMVSGLTLSLYVYSMYGSYFWVMLKANADAQASNIQRLGGDLTNTNTIGLYTAYAVSIGIYYLVVKKTKLLYRLPIMAIIAGCFIVAMATGSKKVVLSLVICMGAMYFFNAIGDKGVIKKLKYFAIFLIGLIGLYIIIMNFDIFSGIKVRLLSQLEFRETGMGSVSDLDRSRLITEGMSHWLDSPLWGNGLCSSVYYMGAYAHNNFVEILTNTGLLGFAAFYSIYVVAFAKFIKNIMILRKVDTVFSLLFALLCSITICGVGMVYYYDRYSMILFAVIYKALVLSRNQIKE